MISSIMLFWYTRKGVRLKVCLIKMDAIIGEYGHYYGIIARNGPMASIGDKKSE